MGTIAQPIVKHLHNVVGKPFLEVEAWRKIMESFKPYPLPRPQIENR